MNGGSSRSDDSLVGLDISLGFEPIQSAQIKLDKFPGTSRSSNNKSPSRRLTYDPQQTLQSMKFSEVTTDSNQLLG